MRNEKLQDLEFLCDIFWGVMKSRTRWAGSVARVTNAHTAGVDTSSESSCLAGIERGRDEKVMLRRILERQKENVWTSLYLLMIGSNIGLL